MYVEKMHLRFAKKLKYLYGDGVALIKRLRYIVLANRTPVTFMDVIVVVAFQNTA